jgi:hypothetical protein
MRFLYLPQKAETLGSIFRQIQNCLKRGISKIVAHCTREVNRSFRLVTEVHKRAQVSRHCKQRCNTSFSTVRPSTQCIVHCRGFAPTDPLAMNHRELLFRRQRMGHFFCDSVSTSIHYCSSAVSLVRPCHIATQTQC